MTEQQYQAAPIFREWIQREHPLASQERVEQLMKAFMVGAWASMGLQSRISKLESDSQRQRMYEELRKEFMHWLDITETNGTKFRASIGGSGI